MKNNFFRGKNDLTYDQILIAFLREMTLILISVLRKIFCLHPNVIKMYKRLKRVTTKKHWLRYVHS
jgi:hypothetical protein